jgi:hypothetical protein
MLSQAHGSAFHQEEDFQNGLLTIMKENEVDSLVSAVQKHSLISIE